MDTKSLTWCWTWNNYTVEDYKSLVEWSTTNCSNFAIGKEVGEKGTPHLQGFWYFKRKKCKKDLIALWGSHLAAVRPPKCTISAAMSYCCKDLDYEYKYTHNNKVRSLEFELPRWKNGLSINAQTWIDKLYNSTGISMLRGDTKNDEGLCEALKYLNFSGYGCVVDDVDDIEKRKVNRCKVIVYIGEIYPGISGKLSLKNYERIVIIDK